MGLPSASKLQIHVFLAVANLQANRSDMLCTVPAPIMALERLDLHDCTVRYWKSYTPLLILIILHCNTKVL